MRDEQTSQSGTPDAASECRSQAPIRGNAHAHRLLALHTGHSCRRYYDALHHTTGMTESVPQTIRREPVGADATLPSLARVCNRLLGGKDNYPPDDYAAAQLEEAAPGQRAAARHSREFQQRVLRYLAGTVGIRQFLDLGAGLPAPTSIPDTHQVTGLHALGEADRPTVVYVDNDPVCNAHGRALLETDDRTHYVMGDLTDPALLHSPKVRTYLDLDSPVGVLLCGVLHHLADGLDTAGVVRGWVEMLPPGSFLVLTHLYDPGPDDPLHPYATACQDRYLRTLGSGWFRSREQITEFFDCLEVVAPVAGAAPGLVEPDEWWPFGPSVRSKSVAERLMLAGVGWKPGPPRAGSSPLRLAYNASRR